MYIKNVQGLKQVRFRIYFQVVVNNFEKGENQLEGIKFEIKAVIVSKRANWNYVRRIFLSKFEI